jgi:hypothetical protein
MTSYLYYFPLYHLTNSHLSYQATFFSDLEWWNDETHIEQWHNTHRMKPRNPTMNVCHTQASNDIQTFCHSIIWKINYFHSQDQHGMSEQYTETCKMRTTCKLRTLLLVQNGLSKRYFHLNRKYGTSEIRTLSAGPKGVLISQIYSNYAYLSLYPHHRLPNY